MSDSLRQFIDNAILFDSHEHLLPWENQRNPHDIFAEYLYHYFCVDLVSSGLPRKTLDLVRSGDLPVNDKWKLIERNWDLCRNTGYGQSLDLAASIYGFERIDMLTIERLNDAFMAAVKSRKHYNRVMHNLCNIEISMLDCGMMINADPEYFICVNRVDSLVYPKYGLDFTNLEEATGICIHSFETYLEACAVRLDQFLTQSRILKCGIAYLRPLSFDRVERSDAEKGFNELFHANYFIEREEQVLHTTPAFQNYVMRYLLGLAQQKGMVIQIHTGLLEGNGNILDHSHPGRLNKLFFEFPDLKFDVFHISYPYQNELGALCKMFPNVYIDMVWANIISPIACDRVLDEWLEFLPYNKIIGFGGDYRFPDGVYGHQKLARDRIYSVLRRKVEEKKISEDRAMIIAHALLYDNAKTLLT
jgi:uncharacterized protein